MITTADVRDAADILRAVFDATGGQDGRVSIEVDPRLAHNTDATAAGAKQLAWLVDRPNTLIKIPATRAGLPAITETIALGISVNVTLIFSLERYRAVMDAYLAGLEKSKANKQRPLWASTGVKDPSLKDTLYVDELVALGTVNTMPEATLKATADHGDIHGNAVAGTYEQARADLDAVEKVGISYEEVVELLEEEGVEKFEASWNELLASTEAELGRLAPSEV